ncbi:succinylglutamate desuccinylase [Aliikangiella maris]|uniref:Succinylglutamate desuccinylase n=2 Tax=Aliikangiella maris TaxID=3162458 RepID=A0ABV2BUJ2_9GAMM
MLSYLEVSDGFIQLSKQAHLAEYEQWQQLPNQVQLKMHDVGVLEVKPRLKSNKALIISCGVHGNETAPIEIVSSQISDIVRGVIEPRVNLLYVLGNPESMKLGKRFVAINMNRLFAGAYNNYPLDEENEYELNRAQQLENYVSDFFTQSHVESRTHLDLHTAIKPSYHQTFAIRPLKENKSRLNDKNRRFLLAMGMEAVLQHNKPSTTFSYYSSQAFAAEAYTLELGKVKPFGENNPQDFADAIYCLNCIVQQNDIVAHDPQKLIEYKVVAEIIRHSEFFKFYINEEVENFTPYPQGYLIAEDFDYNYRVAYSEESVVFPNPDIPIGQRAAVMVTKVTE